MDSSGGTVTPDPITKGWSAISRAALRLPQHGGR